MVSAGKPTSSVVVVVPPPPPENVRTVSHPIATMISTIANEVGFPIFAGIFIVSSRGKLGRNIFSTRFRVLSADGKEYLRVAVRRVWISRYRSGSGRSAKKCRADFTTEKGFGCTMERGHIHLIGSDSWSNGIFSIDVLL